jgi:hypothetical protein
MFRKKKTGKTDTPYGLNVCTLYCVTDDPYPIQVKNRQSHIYLLVVVEGGLGRFGRVSDSSKVRIKIVSGG